MKEKDEIEKLFEKHLTKKHFVFREGDWDKMEQLLDSYPSSSRFINNHYIKGIALLLALSMAFVIGWYANSHLNGIPSKAEENITQISANRQPVLMGEQSIRESTEEDINNQKVDNAHYISSHDKTVHPDNKLSLKDGHKSFTENSPSDSYLRNPDFNSKTEHLQHPTLLKGIKEKQIRTKKIIPGYLKERVKEIKIAPGDEEAKARYSRFSAGISYAPDFTSSGFMNKPQVAQSFGVPVYYHINDSWMIQSGINYVKKKYGSEPEDYVPYEGYWNENTYGKIPDEIEGNCGVIDIPVNVVHQWRSGAGFIFLTSVGMSNYILLNEGYTYTFNGYSKNSYSWESTENSQIIAGIINISVGVSWKINNHITFHVEPYLKVPIKDAGFGNLRLFSTGTAFTLRHRL